MRFPQPQVGLLACVLALTAASLAQKNAARTPRPRSNVILITVDTLRADRLGCYGRSPSFTPAMDALARDSVVFEHAIAQVPLTVPSHDAIMTGTYPYRNGVQDFTSAPLAPELQTIAQAMGRHGYQTGAVVSAFVLDRSWGLARGFDLYDDAFAPADYEHKELGLLERDAGASVDRALAWLRKARLRSKPIFFWLHLYDPHSPYDPPEPFRSQYSGHLYDGEVAYADSQLARLFAWLKQAGMYHSSLIVLLSDHGESLGEHDEQEHGFFLYHATTRVPLIVKLPRGWKQATPRRIAAPAEALAVAPTLVEQLGLHDSIEQQFQAQSLFSAPAEATAYSETFYPFSSFGWSPLHSLESERYHYIEAPQPELYDLATDPGETRNLIAQQTAVTAVLKEKLQQQIAQGSGPARRGAGAISPETAEKLHALGYVAYLSPVSAEALARGLPDPKSRIAEFNAILSAGDALRAGDFTAGEKLLEAARRQDPEMYAIPFMLGQSALRQQHWARAQSELEQSLALNPNFDQAMTALAHAHLGLGQPEQARDWLEKALAANPQNYRAWFELAGLQAGLDPQKAAATYQRTVQVQPNFAQAWRDWGMLLYRQKDYHGAAVRLGKSIELGLREARLYNLLGICYRQTGRPAEAIRNYRLALKMDPDLAEAHLNLALAYQQDGRSGAARAEYAAACRLDAKLCALVPR